MKQILIIQPWISYRGAQLVSLQCAYELKRNHIPAAIACLYVDWSRIESKYKNLYFILPSKWMQVIFRSSGLARLLFGIPILFFLVLFHATQQTVLNPHNLPTSWIAVAVKLFRKNKIIWTVHGVPKQSNHKTGLLDKIIWFIGTSSFDVWIGKQVDIIICVSVKVQEDIKRRYNKDAHVLYPPIDLLLQKKEKTKKQMGFSASDFLLLHVSYLHQAKNPSFSIEVARQVRKLIPSVKLVVVGEGPQKQELVDFVRKEHFESFVSFIGFVSRAKLGEWYHIADAFIAPYWETEGCPLTVFEALLAGTPVVAARGCGADELIEKSHGGVVVALTLHIFSKAIYNIYMVSSKKIRLTNKDFVRRMLSPQTYTSKFISYAYEKTA